MKTPANKPNPRLSKPKLVKVRFDLMSRLAREVFLAGDFNNWNPNDLPLERKDGGLWTTDVLLKPGAHEYLFVVDGTWETDPTADSVPNPFGTRNSVVHVSGTAVGDRRRKELRANGAEKANPRIEPRRWRVSSANQS